MDFAVKTKIKSGEVNFALQSGTSVAYALGLNAPHSARQKCSKLTWNQTLLTFGHNQAHALKYFQCQCLTQIRS